LRGEVEGLLVNGTRMRIVADGIRHEYGHVQANGREGTQDAIGNNARWKKKKKKKKGKEKKAKQRTNRCAEASQRNRGSRGNRIFGSLDP
jgi:hypothetical protein